MEIKKAIFASPPRPTTKRDEWSCTCGISNFSDRPVCRRCGARRPARSHRAASPAPQAEPPARPRPQTRPPTRVQQLEAALAAARSAGATGMVLEGLESEVQTAKETALSLLQTGSNTAVSEQRRAAPEKRVADAEARAAALESAATTFRECGLEARAKELEEEAAVIRKKEAQAPPPGRRLDIAVSYAERAAARAVKAADAVTAAEAAVAEVKKAHDVALAKSEEAKKQLASLRAELAAAQSEPGGSDVSLAEAAADATAIATGAEAADALARARTAVQATEWKPLTLRIFGLSESLGKAIFAGKSAPAFYSTLDQGTAFFLQDALQKCVREAAVASSRTAARAPTPVAASESRQEGAAAPAGHPA